MEQEAACASCSFMVSSPQGINVRCVHETSGVREPVTSGSVIRVPSF